MYKRGYIVLPEDFCKKNDFQIGMDINFIQQDDNMTYRLQPADDVILGEKIAGSSKLLEGYRLNIPMKIRNSYTETYFDYEVRGEEENTDNYYVQFNALRTREVSALTQIYRKLEEIEEFLEELKR